MVLCASAAISNACRMSLRSPGLILDFRERNNERYSLRISFFSCSSFKLYFGICATVSIDDEFTLFAPLIFLKKAIRLRRMASQSKQLVLFDEIILQYDPVPIKAFLINV